MIAQPVWRLLVALLLLLLAIGTVDTITGFEWSFSIFYTIPVGIGSWYLGRRLGFLVCIVSALSWILADYISGHEYSHGLIPFWNAFVRLGYFIIIAYLLDRLRSALDLQKALAQHDGLTGLFNSRTFKQRCDAIFELASRHNRSLALGYLDLDGFKAINDQLGHNSGDQILQAVATVLRERLRGSDIGGRLGGDEFAILLPETDLAGAKIFFTKLRENLNDLAADKNWQIGFSIGVAVLHKPAATSDTAIHYADSLMYKVKKSGKNSILYAEYS